MKKIVDQEVLNESDKIYRYCFFIALIFVLAGFIIRLTDLTISIDFYLNISYIIPLISLLATFYYLLFAFAKKGIILGFKKKIYIYPIIKILFLTIIISLFLSFLIWFITPQIYKLFSPIYESDSLYNINNSFWNDLNYSKYAKYFLASFIVFFMFLNIHFLIAYFITRIKRKEESNVNFDKIYKNAFFVLFIFLLINLATLSLRGGIPLYRKDVWRIIVELVITIIIFTIALISHARKGLLIGALEKSMDKYPMRRCLLNSVLYSAIMSVVTFIIIPFLYYLILSISWGYVRPLVTFYGYRYLYIASTVFLFILYFIFLNLCYLSAYIIIKKSKQRKDFI